MTANADNYGKIRAFIRAAYLMEERPSLGHLIKQVAACHQEIAHHKQEQRSGNKHVDGQWTLPPKKTTL
jgi:hypothetical protein